MNLLSYPTDFVPRPFAQSGTYQVIPESSSALGRASYEKGFPTETQLPLSQGGVAPNRTDFNGLFNLLTSFAFWQQSGGQWVYNTELNYAQPSVVFHNGVLWWCQKENGAGTGSGVIPPGTDKDYWLEFFKYISEGKVEGGLNPVGTVIMFTSASAPEGYFACDGSTFSASENPLLFSILGSTTLPDMRGQFVRGYDPDGVVDPDGEARDILSKQGFAMEKIYGQFGFESAIDGSTGVATLTGAFSKKVDYSRRRIASGIGGSNHLVIMDSSNVTQTAIETRPSNLMLLYCIKHD